MTEYIIGISIVMILGIGMCILANEEEKLNKGDKNERKRI